MADRNIVGEKRGKIKREEKKRLNKELLGNAFWNNGEKIIEQLRCKPGDMKPDVNSKDEKGMTCLHYAALHGNLKLANQLLFHEADLDCENLEGQTPLILAAQRLFSSHFCDYFYRGFLEIIQSLLLAGAELNQADRRGNTALHYAAKLGRLFE